MKSFIEYLNESAAYSYKYTHNQTRLHLGDFFIGIIEQYLRKNNLPIMPSSISNDAVNVRTALNDIFKNCDITNPQSFAKALEKADSRFNVIESGKMLSGRVFVKLKDTHGNPVSLIIKKV